MVFAVLPDLLLPEHISRWERGKWGEELTAKELKPLMREGWTVRHDLATRWAGNRDHVVGGSAVFLLDSKNLNDSEVRVDGCELVVTRIDNPEDSYKQDKPIYSIERSARSFSRELAAEVGFPVAVYPVIVLWAIFPQETVYAGNVAVVSGERLAEFIRGRPVDLFDVSKRESVARWLRALPSA
jgi:hypothetical protein